MSGNLSKVFQLSNVETSIITLKAYCYTINERLLQMERPKGANGFLLTSQFQLVGNVYLEHCF